MSGQYFVEDEVAAVTGGARPRLSPTPLAGVTQLAECLSCKQEVAGSKPVAGSSFRRGFYWRDKLAVNQPPQCCAGSIPTPSSKFGAVAQLAQSPGLSTQWIRVRIPFAPPGLLMIRWTNWLCHEAFNLVVAGSNPVRISKFRTGSSVGLRERGRSPRGRPFESVSVHQLSGGSSAWPEFLVWNQDVAGSNPASQTISCGHSSSG